MRRLIINADDFGITAAVNKGVIQAFKEGILTSASLMMNMPGTEEAVRLALENKELDVGIHISLVGARPVLKPELLPNLVDSNGFLPRRGMHLVKRLIFNKELSKEIELEIRAQIEKFKMKGLNPTHLDSHDHVHLYPAIFKMIVRLAKEYDILFIRCPNGRLMFNIPLTNIFHFRCLMMMFIFKLSQISRKALVENGISTVDFFWGIIYSGALSKKNLKHILDRLPTGTNEIMCHPGYIDEGLLKIFPVRYKWEEELNALLDPGLKELIKKRNIQLINYRDLKDRVGEEK